MKFKERKKSIKFPIFVNYTVNIIVTNDKQKSLKKIANKYKLVIDQDHFEALSINVSDYSTSFLLFGENPSVGTIAHEVWHTVRHMLVEWVGAGLDNEVVAYHLGYLTQQVYDVIYS